MADFSFDIVSEYDKAEMNNVFDQSQREINNRYDFKSANIVLEWLDGDKTGIKIIGENQYQLDAIVDIFRKKLSLRGQNLKTLDIEINKPNESNFKISWEIPFKKGLNQEKAKQITSLIRETFPKTKTQIQGDAVRVSSAKKDDLQSVMALLRTKDFDYPLSFNNFR
ncbi:MAG TPA: YajQ family cyclic di-GMP-binding protein [Candidatus Saccharimonadales bacterium]